MKQIVKSGNRKDELKMTKRFECRVCECVFDCSIEETWFMNTPFDVNHYWAEVARCPECAAVTDRCIPMV